MPAEVPSSLANHRAHNLYLTLEVLIQFITEHGQVAMTVVKFYPKSSVVKALEDLGFKTYHYALSKVN